MAIVESIPSNTIKYADIMQFPLAKHVEENDVTIIINRVDKIKAVTINALR